MSSRSKRFPSIGFASHSMTAPRASSKWRNWWSSPACLRRCANPSFSQRLPSMRNWERFAGRTMPTSTPTCYTQRSPAFRSQNTLQRDDEPGGDGPLARWPVKHPFNRLDGQGGLYANRVRPYALCVRLAVRSDSLNASGRRPEDLVVLDLPEAVRRRQPTIDREPLVRVPEVRQVESTEAGQRHSGVTNDEIIFDLATPSAVSNIEVESFAAPFGEHLDRVVEGTGIARTQLEEPRELRGEPGLRPPIDLLPQQCRH